MAEEANSLFNFFRSLLFFGSPSESLHRNPEEETSSRVRKHTEFDELLIDAKTKHKASQDAVENFARKLNHGTGEKIKSITRREVSDVIPHELGDCKIQHPHHVQVLFLMHVPSEQNKKQSIASNNLEREKNPLEESIMQWVREIDASEKQNETASKTITTVEENNSFSISSNNASALTAGNNEIHVEEKDDPILVFDKSDILDIDIRKRKKKEANSEEVTATEEDGDSTSNATANKNTTAEQAEEGVRTTINPYSLKNKSLKIWNIQDVPKIAEEHLAAEQNVSKSHFLLISGGTEKSATAKTSETQTGIEQETSYYNLTRLKRVKRTANDLHQNELNSSFLNNEQIKNATLLDSNMISNNFNEIDSNDLSFLEEKLGRKKNHTETSKMVTTKSAYDHHKQKQNNSSYNDPNKYFHQLKEKFRTKKQKSNTEDSTDASGRSNGEIITKPYFFIVTLPTVFSKIYYVYF